MEHKDVLGDSKTSLLNQGFTASESDSKEQANKSMEQLITFFKEQLDAVKTDMEKLVQEGKTCVENDLNIRLLAGVLTGGKDDVAAWTKDTLNLFKVVAPHKSGQIQAVLDDLENIKKMTSVLSLQSFKVMLKPLMVEKHQLNLEQVVRQVNENSLSTISSNIEKFLCTILMNFLQLENDHNLPAEHIYYQAADQGTDINDSGPLQGDGQVTISEPVGSSSRKALNEENKVHGKDALLKIKDFNPDLYRLLEKAFDPKK